MDLGWRTLGRLLVAFAAWSVLGAFVLPGYSRLVVPATEGVLRWLQPHGLVIALEVEHPYVRWSFATAPGHEEWGRLPLTLLTYNAVIYLALVSGVPGLPRRWRLGFAATALPAVFLFHVADLALGVESRILSVIQAEHYDFVASFGLWFTVVKVYNFLSVMAVKQVVFVGLFYAQWRLFRWRPSGPSTS